MSNFRVFLLKHRFLATLLLGTPFAIIYGLLAFTSNASPIMIVLVVAASYLIGIAASGTSLVTKPSRAAITSLENCDPYPLLRLMEFCLTLRHSKMSKQIYTINLAAALSSLGEHERMYAVLKEMDIDGEAGVVPQTRFYYYNNLLAACHLLGKYEEASVYHDKLLKAAKHIKKEKAQARLYPMLLNADGDAAYRRGEYEEAVRFYDSALSAQGTAVTRRATSHLYLDKAKALLALEKREEALPFLTAVRDGGTPNAKSEAERLLASIDEAQIES